MTYDAIILDTETTTNKDTPERKLEVIELAWEDASPAVATIADSPRPTDFERRYLPETPATFGATAVHHILHSELAGCAPAAHAPLDVPPAQYWIGHNIDFDWKALGSPRGVRRICTLALGRSLYPESDAHNLSALMYYVFGCNDETRNLLRNAHSAADDCVFVRMLLAEMLKLVPCETLEDLWELSEQARIPTKMSFGKFAGESISKVDRGYASWYSRTSDPDEYVLKAFKQAGLLR